VHLGIHMAREAICQDDPELGSFEDEDFDETKEQIEALLKTAS
jgi:hypothetical protein